MAVMVSLTVSPRRSGVKAAALRRGGSVPCVLYGPGTGNTLLQCEHRVLGKAIAQAGGSTLVELSITEENRKVPVLFHEVVLDPVRDTPLHVDFYAVDLTKEVEVSVPLHFEGVSPAVRDLGGVIVVTLDHVTVCCLPTDLPQHFSVSLDPLAQFGDVLTVAAIPLPPRVRIVQEPSMVIATVQEPRKEEEVAPPPAATAEGAAVPAEGAAVPAVPGTEGTPPPPAAAERGKKGG